MQVLQNYSLRKHNTFGIDVLANSFARFTNLDELQQLLKKPGQKPVMVLGGGSNVLFTGDYPGFILRNEIKGREVTGEDEEFYYVKAGAGENWHLFVMHCIDHDYAGVENLSLIPGNVGASPMQNIGAYGVEVKDVFHELEALHVKDNQLYRFSAADCEFGYRESVFKRKYKDQFVILNVTFRLRKVPRFNTSYGAIETELTAMGVQDISIRAISQAVINIRTSKLPDPAVIGNAGSFFKNPQVSSTKFSELNEKHPSIVGYAVDDNTVKLAAGWLIEQCGWKGFRRGDAGCHARQALVLVNYGNASGKEIFDLSEEILQSVTEKFGVQLEREVNVV
jgi:UDP-N-acetylmuramate dehydrogenase